MWQSIIRFVFYPLDFTIDALQGSFNPDPNKKFLEGNYAPVDKEWFQSNLPVTGVIPNDLLGEFVRNGPNPKHIPKGGYHWFDGDGMIHGVRFTHGGIASYVNRWTRTERFLDEEKANRQLYIRIGEMKGKLGLLKLMLLRVKEFLGYFAPSYDHLQNGTANTALQYHNGTFMALVESDVPMAIKILMDGRLEEIGRLTYNNKLKHPFTAHPKVDPETQEMMFFGYQIMNEPNCLYSVVSSEGELLSTVDIGIKRPVMMHDFAITEHYSIFMDHPLEFKPRSIATGKFAFQFNENVPSRIGVIPRHGKSADDVTWFEFQSGYVFHTANAWEEGDEVVLICCRSDHIQLNDLTVGDCMPVLHEYRVNMKTKESSERDIFTQKLNCEFPKVNDALLGRKTKFCYVAEMNGSGLDFGGCLKVDLEVGAVVGRISFGEGCAGGECVFVAKADAQSEDDGYLLTFVFDSATNTSVLWVMDAKTMAPEPIACVELPQRVPFGFHGMWVTEDQIVNQKAMEKTLD